MFPGGNAATGAFQAIGDVGHFLAQRGWRGRLAVRAAHHRHFSVNVRQFFQAGK
jgi:hypothetical protein